MKRSIVILTVVALLNASAFGQSSSPNAASGSRTHSAVREWLNRGLSAVGKTEAKYQSELFASAAVVQSRLGEKAAATASVRKALGLLAKARESERSFVQSEIARAWAWLGEDEKAMGIALLSTDEFNVTSAMMQIAVVQHDRGEPKLADKTLKLVLEKINAMRGDDWSQQTLLADVVNTYAWQDNFEQSRRLLKRITMPGNLIDATCWIMLAETKLGKVGGDRIRQIKATLPKLEAKLKATGEVEDAEFSASNLADIYARLGDAASAERMLKLVTDPSSRSYVLAAIAAAHARGNQRDKFELALKRSLKVIDDIKFDPDFDNDVAYDKAWALASVATTMVFEGVPKEAPPLFDRAKPGLQRAIMALYMAETLLDETQRSK